MEQQTASPSTRRTLRFDDYAAARAEIERLRGSAYAMLGQWNLGQICAHLNYYYRGSLDGFGFNMPWILRVTLGNWLWASWMKTGQMKAGMNTVAASRPGPDTDDAQEIETALTLLTRLETQRDLHPSPLFGNLNVDQWRQLHLLHTAHHLSFLQPTP